MSTAEINYLDIDLVVEYDFEAGEEATRDEPGCADEASITAVLVGDVEIKEIIGANHLQSISEQVAAGHEDDRAAEHANRLIKQYKESEVPA